MPAIKVRCPKCGTEQMIDDNLLGKMGRCKKPHCGHVFLLARRESDPPSTTAASSSGPVEGTVAEAVQAGYTSDDRPRGEDGIPLTWESGDVILDLYEVTGVLGEGGMGRVYKVHHRGWNQDLAVKCPRPEVLAKVGGAERFEVEAETWVNLGLHPHIAPCHYVRRLGGIPRVFVAYLPGGSLADWVRDGRLYEGGPDLTLGRILDVAIQFAWGLHYAHERGLVHQDVKPDNVLMTHDGTALVTDFGLARSRPHADDPGQALSRYGDVTGAAGTRSYQSPEQAAGERLTHHTDVWSWAVSVVDLFAGATHRGFGVGAPDALEQYLKKGPGDRRLPRMPVELVALLRQCFRPAPGDRPKSLAAGAELLRALYGRAVGGAYPRPQPEAADLLADSLNNRAVSLFDLGKRQEAEQAWQEALRVDPHHPEATYNGGLIQWRSARLTDQKLLQNLREVRASSAEAARVDYLLGLVHLERTDAQAAVHSLSKAVEAGTGRAEITSALALAQSLDTSSEHFSRPFEGHTDQVRSVSWSPDGRFALSGGWDKTLRLWEVSSGKCLRTFEGHTERVASVSWSTDGRYALSGSWDGTLRLWELDWEFEQNQPADWDEGARPFLIVFLTLHTPYVDGLVQRGRPTWTEDDFRRLLDKLCCAGYGWLRSEGVRDELEKMAARRWGNRELAE